MTQPILATAMPDESMGGPGIVDLNASAVNMLAKGRYSDTIPLFRLALSILHGYLTGHCVRNYGAVSCKKFELTLIACQACATSSSEEAAFVLYNKAVCISSNDATAMNSVPNHALTSMILLYNMGLACHLHAIQGGCEQKANLDRALLSYQLALKLIRNTTNLCGIDNFLLMAISNNMGNIYEHLCNVEGAQRCHKGLHQALIAISDNCCEIATEEDILIFHANLLFGDNFLLNAPAA